MKLWLTGFMGAGKTTTGRRLARILKVPFADTDAEIEREHGSIADIFAGAGEETFRTLETEFIARLAGGEPAVVAVGGGAIVAEANRSIMRSDGVIVHLSITPAGALARVAHRTHRPVLGQAPDLVTISEVMAARADAYADHDFCVRVDGKTPTAVAHVIARWYVRRAAASEASAR